MMFRWVNKLPQLQKFWNLCCHYQGICDCISLFNPLKTSPEYTWAGIDRKCMLQQNQIVVNELKSTGRDRSLTGD